LKLSAFFSSKSESDKLLSGYIKRYFGFTPFNLQLYKQAVIHKSVTKNRTAGIRHSNERLEFLGDAILDAIVGDYLYNNFPDRDEGFLTKARSKLVSRTHLVHLAESTGLEKLIICDINDESVRLGLAGNAIEAIIGAIYLKKGYKFTKTKLLKLVERFTNIDDFISKDEDYKSLLFHWSQKHRKKLDYKSKELEEENGFEVSLYVDEEFVSKATGSNKKSAEKESSRLALNILSINQSL